MKTRYLDMVALFFMLPFANSPVLAREHGPFFIPDTVFQGSSLHQWSKLGNAAWSARDGEITGAAAADTGGWLFLDKSLSGLAFYSSILNKNNSKSGILLRATPTSSGGYTGIYVAFCSNDRGIYSVEIDRNGQEIGRKPLQAGKSDGGLVSLFGNTPPELLATFQTPEEMTRKALEAPWPHGIKQPQLIPELGEYKAGGRNELSLLLYNNVLKPSVNGGPDGTWINSKALSQTLIPEEVSPFGQIALYVGGPGSVSFRSVAYKDLLVHEISPQTVSPAFELRRLSSYYFSLSAAVGDINKDGFPDIVAGPFVYLGPDFKRAQEIYPPRGFNPTAEYAQTSTFTFVYDVNRDGWPDILAINGQAGKVTGIVYENPKEMSQKWKSRTIVEQARNEVTLLRDIDRDGSPELIHGVEGGVGYSKPDPANPAGKWITTRVSAKAAWRAAENHGLGVGDVNGDGRPDILTPEGWWEQPANIRDGQPEWRYHPQIFGRSYGIGTAGAGGAEIGVYDVNGDGLNDVVTALEAHEFGLGWYEQIRDGKGKISFREHLIMDQPLAKNAGGVVFSQPHGTHFADIDGDGLPDFITGKRAMSHLMTYFDPDPMGQPVMYVYKTRRNPAAPGGAEFVPELINNVSGFGNQIAVSDLNSDGIPDIAASGATGVYILFNHYNNKVFPARSEK